MNLRSDARPAVLKAITAVVPATLFDPELHVAKVWDGRHWARCAFETELLAVNALESGYMACRFFITQGMDALAAGRLAGCDESFGPLGDFMNKRSPSELIERIEKRRKMKAANNVPRWHGMWGFV